MKPTRYDDDGPKEERRRAIQGYCRPIGLENRAVAVVVLLKAIFLLVIRYVLTGDKPRTDSTKYQPRPTQSRLDPATCKCPVSCLYRHLDRIGVRLGGWRCRRVVALSVNLSGSSPEKTRPPAPEKSG
jgi:hypothetical protein